MIKRIDNKKMGKSDLGWLRSKFHFSFAEYFNPLNINFGVLRVLNDDLIDAGEGFDTHPHENMEIVSYVVNGKLTHADSMGNTSTLKRGEVQYMSAGTGVYHSEFNNGNEELRLLQMWIIPNKRGYKPNYGEHRFKWEDRMNKWLHIVSGDDINVPINIQQDLNMYTTYLEKDEEISFEVKKGRQAYLVQIEGDSYINNIEAYSRDAVEIIEESIEIKANEDSHFIILEMKKSEALYI